MCCPRYKDREDLTSATKIINFFFKLIILTIGYVRYVTKYYTSEHELTTAMQYYLKNIFLILKLKNFIETW